MPLRANLAVLILPLLVAACSSMTVAERTSACQAVDWSVYGQNDGRLGVAATERDEKFADCAELGHPPDLAAYQAGRTAGLESYCTLENGYNVGYAGRGYSGVCPAELNAGFLQGYDQGRRDRPVNIYPSFGIGFGFSHFGYRGHRHFRSHRHRGQSLNQNVK
jgi:hypothetical protein